MGREAVADPPEIFGTIRPRHVRARVEPPAEERAVQQHVPRRQREDALRELDDGEDDGGVVPDLSRARVGGGGLIGRLLEKLLGDARSASGGPPGADAPTRWSSRAARVARTVALTTRRCPTTSQPSFGRGTTYPEWDLYRRRYRHDWCTVVELEPKPEDSRPS